MPAKRIIPCLDVDKGRVVKGKKFKDIQDVDDPIALAKRYNKDGADELVFYDITASNEDRNIFLDMAEKIATEIAIPFTVGGGIRSLDDIQRVLHAGADKASINSAAVKNPDLIKQAASKFSSARIVLSIDAKKTGEKKWEVFTNGGRVNTGLDVLDWAKRGEALGAGELVLNAIETDGEKSGYDLDLIQAAAQTVNIPIVASGGAGKHEHFSSVLAEGFADAALAASVFHYDEIPIPDLKTYLAEEGIVVRRNT